ncbi:hypothetical protein HJG60_001788 [Phyllostomus discolor]|uniref:Uncharacterized protein n=1 Tax=Phyllostomus discolor TaxID=89673 RepID=A0A833ZAL3_9CHIR|nr:hypothetical protein HJG60_001788 [Phyllostomus discolor]
MKTAEEPAPNLGQTLEWLRKELAEMQIQDQKLLLTLRHLHSVLEELRSESAHWEDARSSGGASPIRARAGSEVLRNTMQTVKEAKEGNDEENSTSLIQSWQ